MNMLFITETFPNFFQWLYTFTKFTHVTQSLKYANGLHKNISYNTRSFWKLKIYDCIFLFFSSIFTCNIFLSALYMGTLQTMCSFWVTSGEMEQDTLLGLLLCSRCTWCTLTSWLSTLTRMEMKQEQLTGYINISLYDCLLLDFWHLEIWLKLMLYINEIFKAYLHTGAFISPCYEIPTISLVKSTTVFWGVICILVEVYWHLWRSQMV